MIFYVFAIFALIMSLISGKKFLNILVKNKIIQPIYEEAPDIHKTKGGTPTMGGITFIIPLLILLSISLLFIVETEQKFLMLTIILVILGYAYIGFKDDILKITHKQNDSGLTKKQKLIYQFAFAIIAMISIYLYATPSNFLLYFGEYKILYYLLMIIAIVGFSNATNLTDGLDALLSSVTIVTFSSIFIIANSQNNLIVSIVSITIIFVLIGFLKYNLNPAKMFMGDTGSLMIGAVFWFCIILLKIELLAFLIGFIYVVEILSVTFQISYFKITKKICGTGKRIFLMSPLHHHYEKKGTKEKRIVLNFVLVQLMMSIIALLIYFR